MKTKIHLDFNPKLTACSFYKDYNTRVTSNEADVTCVNCIKRIESRRKADA